MDPKLVRFLLVGAFALNLVFLGLVLTDYGVWDGQYVIPLFIAWGVVMILSIVLGLFAKPRIQVVERVVERITVQAPPVTRVRTLPPVAPAPLQTPATPVAKPAPSRTVKPHPTRPVRPAIAVREDATPAGVPSRLSAFAPPEPFVYNGFTLHTRGVTLKGGGQRSIYFFAKSKPRSGKPCAKPTGFHVGVNERTGLPFLKKGAGVDGEDVTPEVADEYQPQCSALTEGGRQCRNSARGGSRYCSSHKGYQPPGAGRLAAIHDTHSDRAAVDVEPILRGKAGSEIIGEQCGALAGSGNQCKNQARRGSKYCASHKGYQPPTAKSVLRLADTRPRVRGAKDTMPTVRKDR